MEHAKVKISLEEKALKIFTQNKYSDDKFYFHQPSDQNYCSFFAWDSGWNIISLSSLDPEAAFQELQTVFSVQMQDGRIPHETRLVSLKDKLFRRILLFALRKQFDSEGRSYLIDPPSYLLAAEILYNKSHDSRIFTLLPAMENLIQYYISQRNCFNDNLISIFHPWESGTDVAPIFDVPFKINPSRIGWKLKYFYSYFKLEKQLEKLHWQTNNIQKENIFLFEDLCMNGIATAGILSVANLFKAKGDMEKYSYYQNIAQEITSAMEKYLWNEEEKFFFPRWDKKNPQNSVRKCITGVLPLLSGLVSKKKADQIIESYILSQEHFANEWVIPFNSKSDLEPFLSFKGQILWRGPCIWINMNWMVAHIMTKYGRKDLAKQITLQTIKLIEKSGFREYYDPNTGIGGGAINFTWPTLIIDMISEHL